MQSRSNAYIFILTTKVAAATRLVGEEVADLGLG